MLPSGLQMLPLLWLLLWTARLGLSSPTLYNRGHYRVGETIGAQSERVCKENTAEPEQETEYYPTNVRVVKMVARNNDVYKRFRNSWHSLHLVFNATELRNTVPDPSALVQAELTLHLLKQREMQTVLLFERYGRKAWRSIKSWVLFPSSSEEWVSLDVTGVVCQWLRHRGGIEVFRLTAERLPDNKDSVLHMEISGINPTCHIDFPEDCGITTNQPFLRLETYPPYQPVYLDGSVVNNKKDAAVIGVSYNEVVTRVPMLDINNEVYKQLPSRQNSVYMIFNKTDLQEAVPDSSLLSRAELHLLRRKQHQEQTVRLYEGPGNNVWRNINNRFLAQDTEKWMWFDVTEVVRRWLNQRNEEPVKAFRLRFISMGEVEEETQAIVDIRGLTPSSSLGDNPDVDIKNRPFLVLVSSRRE